MYCGWFTYQTKNDTCLLCGVCGATYANESRGIQYEQAVLLLTGASYHNYNQLKLKTRTKQNRHFLFKISKVNE